MSAYFDSLVAELLAAAIERDLPRAVAAGISLSRFVERQIEQARTETSPRPVAVLERSDEPPASPTRTRRADGTGERRTFPTGA